MRSLRRAVVVLCVVPVAERPVWDAAVLISPIRGCGDPPQRGVGKTCPTRLSLSLCSDGGTGRVLLYGVWDGTEVHVRWYCGTFLDDASDAKPLPPTPVRRLCDDHQRRAPYLNEPRADPTPRPNARMSRDRIHLTFIWDDMCRRQADGRSRWDVAPRCGDGDGVASAHGVHGGPPFSVSLFWPLPKRIGWCCTLLDGTAFGVNKVNVSISRRRCFRAAADRWGSVAT